ncbi:MAG: hypothetical protein HXX10_19920 [Rhodoplanes sp.]|uniref:hypothetical protein n=1 Tax=Rhodoplanes sp. TaxID=1968906 RepID=UPI0017C54982|nr:hypothetical protein [Rhodoplanes sp.]NVO16302.1 hypothetical protein [Rhodoplanes sp.]
MSETDLKSEIQTPVHEPLLPIEKKLVAWSLGSGLVLLTILILLTRVSWGG